VAEQLRLEVTGIDLLFDESGFTVCEANSSPGFSGLEPSCNVNAAGAILEAALRKAKGGKSAAGPGLPGAGLLGKILQWGRKTLPSTFKAEKAAA
jgi:hypothetical protein